MKAKLILENGCCFEGSVFGYEGETTGTAVFHTGMNGYQEVISDPASQGQILVMTYPLVGNYGVNIEDSESSAAQIRALVVKEACTEPNNFRCELELEDYLKAHRIIGLEGVDTRALTRALRKSGSQRATIVLESSSDSPASIKERFQSSAILPTISNETARYRTGNGKRHAAVLDLGITRSQLALLTNLGYSVSVYPQDATAEEIFAEQPEFVYISSGCDAREISEALKSTVRALCANLPILAVGFGQAVVASAFGGTLKAHLYGHHGSQPVHNLRTGRIYTTAQNHTLHIDQLPEAFIVSHTNVNDNSIEGFRHRTLPIHCVSFYPNTPSNAQFNDGVIANFLSQVQKEEQHA